jgi:hypothetical protein
MGKNRKLLRGTGVILLALGVYILIRERRSSHKRLKKVANEGYETAIDVLYPRKEQGGRLHYGPVLPS